MAPASKTELSRSEDDYYGIKGDRKVRIKCLCTEKYRLQAHLNCNCINVRKIIFYRRESHWWRKKEERASMKVCKSSEYCLQT